MKTVPLAGLHGTGRVALVDDADYDLVMQHRWLAKKGRNDTFYAYRYFRDGAGAEQQQFMHSLLTGWSVTDHRDHDGLNNQRCNLRDGGSAGNQRNTRKVKPRTSVYKGVCWDKGKQKWYARISVNGQQIGLGRYASEKRAALAYDAAAREHYGEYAWLNFPADGAVTVDLDSEPPEIDLSQGAKTHCINGHEFTPANTYLPPCGGRHCRACRTTRAQERKSA